PNAVPLPKALSESRARALSDESVWLPCAGVLTKSFVIVNENFRHCRQALFSTRVLGLPMLGGRVHPTRIGVREWSVRRFAAATWRSRGPSIRPAHHDVPIRQSVHVLKRKSCRRE